MGTIYGVTVTAAIVQNVLMAKLPETLGPDATEEVCFLSLPFAFAFAVAFASADRSFC